MEIKDGVLIINGRTVGKVSDVEIDSITNTVNSINKSINAWKDSIYSKTASFEEGLFAYMCNDFENLRDYKLSDGIVYYKGKRVGRYLFTEEEFSYTPDSPVERITFTGTIDLNGVIKEDK